MTTYDIDKKMGRNETSGFYKGQLHVVRHEPLLLDRTVCLPLYSMWPSFGYFSTVIHISKF